MVRQAGRTTAVEDWKRIVGDPYVLTGQEIPERYHLACIPGSKLPVAVVCPGDVGEVRAVVRAASRYRMPLYPISTGKNWGYGTASPVGHDNVILDLGRLKRIVEVNVESAYAVIEPGVTQRQLYEYLRDNDLPLHISPTGAGPDCSVLANTLERGFGITPGGRHVNAATGLEVVLADGRLLKTGFGHYEGARSTYVYNHGLGPFLDGLFCQSNLGVVVRMGLELERTPPAFEAFYAKISSTEKLTAVLEMVRELRLRGVLNAPVNFLHRDRSLAMSKRREEVRQNPAYRRRTPAWAMAGSLSGDKGMVAAAKKALRRALRGQVSQLVFLNERRLRWLERFPRLFGLASGMDPAETLPLLRKGFGIMRGRPSEVSMPLCYWRARKAAPDQKAEPSIDPAKDRCGLMWFAPISPCTAADVERLKRTADEIFARHGFDNMPTITALTARALAWTMPILFDRENPRETQQAAKCHAELVAACRKAGYLPYRTGVDGMRELISTDDVFWRTIARLKRALDPAGILAPGRYAPDEDDAAGDEEAPLRLSARCRSAREARRPFTASAT